MSKYKVWDKTSNIITPIGEVLTPAQWIKRYPVAEVLDVVCGGGEINGSVFAVYSQFVQQYADMGCNFEGCTTKQDYLDRIEQFEKELNSQPVITDETRIADALEDLVVMQLPEEE